MFKLASRSAGRWHGTMTVPDAGPVRVEGLERLQRVVGVDTDLAVRAARHDHLLAGQEARGEHRMPCDATMRRSQMLRASKQWLEVNQALRRHERRVSQNVSTWFRTVDGVTCWEDLRADQLVK